MFALNGWPFCFRLTHVPLAIPHELNEQDNLMTSLSLTSIFSGRLEISFLDTTFGLLRDQ